VCLNQIYGFFDVIQVDRLKRLCGKVFYQIGATEIKGEGFGKIRIGNLFGPII